MKTSVLDFYKDYLGKRYTSFQIAFNHLAANPQNIIVELGTTRSFVDELYPGCRCTDPAYWNEENLSQWDWGAGIFTRVAAEIIHSTDNILYTVDPLKEAIIISKRITEAFKGNIEYCNFSSTNFLLNIEGEIDLIYMDHHETCEEGAILHLQDAKIIVEKKLLSDSGLILIDDVHISHNSEHPIGRIENSQSDSLGKGKYSIPFLEAHGYKKRFEGYQVIMEKISH
jgi:hypothetical protein